MGGQGAEGGRVLPAEVVGAGVPSRHHPGQGRGGVVARRRASWEAQELWPGRRPPCRLRCRKSPASRACPLAAPAGGALPGVRVLRGHRVGSPGPSSGPTWALASEGRTVPPRHDHPRGPRPSLWRWRCLSPQGSRALRGSGTSGPSPLQGSQPGAPRPPASFPRSPFRAPETRPQGTPPRDLPGSGMNEKWLGRRLEPPPPIPCGLMRSAPTSR